MKYLYVLLIFLSGMVAANNLGMLVEVNADYDAQWWKVFLAMFFAVFFGLLVTE